MKKSSNFNGLGLKARTFLLIVPIFLGLSIQLYSQVSSPTNFPGGGSNDYLGWNNTVSDNLEIRHDAPTKSIIFGTDQTERIRINTEGTVIINDADDQARMNTVS